jgi:[ribosomal protein S18]-alanine N-acetyltransferase
MAQSDAEAVVSWHYPEPFSFYDWTADEHDLAELLDAERRGEAYFAVEDDEG